MTTHTVSVMLTHDRLSGEIVAQTQILLDAADGADLSVTVPSCPDWTLGQLLRHVGHAQQEATKQVSARASGPVSGYGEHSEPPVDDDYSDIGPWLMTGATALADALREAGPDVPLWTPVGEGTAAFYSRRMACETLLHRVDGELAVGAKTSIDADLAIDAIEEWLTIGSLPFLLEYQPARRELLGGDRTVHLHATDAAQDEPGEWVIDFTGDVITWRRGHEKATVAIRGPLADLLLVLYKRRAPTEPDIAVLGDGEFLRFWLDRVSFG